MSKLTLAELEALLMSTIEVLSERIAKIEERNEKAAALFRTLTNSHTTLLARVQRLEAERE